MNRHQAAPKLSVAIIVRNAAEPLAETLESIRGLADEVVVVDTGSTDETRDVAARFDARCYSIAWQDDFSAARNHAASLCTGEWILWLDAGERLSESNAHELRSFVEQEAARDTAYMMIVRVPAQPHEIAGEQIGAIRLVPNDPAIRFTGRVRETLTPALNAGRFQVEGIAFRIERGLREHDRDLKVRRAKRNIQLAELEMRERGPQAALLNVLGDAFLALRQQERAAHFFHQAITLSAKGSSDMLAAYYGLVMAIEGSDQGRQGQLSACVAALETFPVDAQLLCASGGYLQALGQFETAAKAYETAYRFGKVNPEVWHLCGIAEVAAGCYALALQQQGKYEMAAEVLAAQLKIAPENLRLRRQLLALCIRRGDRKAALAQVDQLPPETPYVEALKSAVRGACLAVAGKWVPARAYLEAAYRNGSRDPICLEYYTLAMLAEGETAAAIPLLAEWRSADPLNPEISRLIATVSQAVSSGVPVDVRTRALRVDSIMPPIRLSAPTAAPAMS
jgi:tetratricopeptide (TPR) repeat protein